MRLLNLVLVALAISFVSCARAHAQLVADFNRNGRIDAADEQGSALTTAEQQAYNSSGVFRQKGAIVWANLDYDEAENRDLLPNTNTLARIVDDRPVPDSIRFYHDGTTFEATAEDFVLRPGEAGWERHFPDYTPPPTGEYRSPCPDISPLKIKRMPQLPPTTRVYLETPSVAEVHAFHLYKHIPDFENREKQEQAIWGAFDFSHHPWADGDSKQTDIEITKWVNENAAGFVETRPEGQADFIFGIEAMLYRGMPYPFSRQTDGPTFNGFVTFRLVLVDAAGRRTIFSKVRLTFLRQPAFPGAEGFGRWAQGGRGGEVVQVTSLADSDTPGTLRYAVDDDHRRTINGGQRLMPRTVLFKKSGLIRLGEKLSIESGHLTIAGQSAPVSGSSCGGITLTGNTLRVKGDSEAIGYDTLRANDVILRYVRSRRALTGASEDEDPPDGDAFTLQGAGRVIVDHCSFSWGLDGSLDITQGDEADNQPEMSVTIQWSNIQQTLRAHSKASLVNGKNGARYSIHHCYYSHHDERSPRLGSYTGDLGEGSYVEFTSNVIYNWNRTHPAGHAGDDDSDFQHPFLRFQFLNNYYRLGSDTGSSTSGITAFVNEAAKPVIFFSGNYLNGSKWRSAYQYVNTASAVKRTQRFFSDGVTAQDALTALQEIKTHGGCCRGPNKRDWFDAYFCSELPPGDSRHTRIIDKVTTLTADDIESFYPETTSAFADIDRDLLPDVWEDKFGGPAAIRQWEDLDGDGWTNLEEYLNKTNPLVGDDPYKLTEGKIFGVLE